MSDRNPGDEGSTLPRELLDLAERVAAYPHGLGFLHLAPLETIAITLGVNAYVADRARSMLMTPEGRATLIAEVRAAKARASGSTRPADGIEPAAQETATPETAASVEELVQRALEHPLGVRFLLDGPMETVAITLRAHVFLVLEARDMLHAQYGLQAHLGEDGDA
jgi:hypothetical protein